MKHVLNVLCLWIFTSSCSLITVPVKTAGGIVETTVKTAGGVAEAPFNAVAGRKSDKKETDVEAKRE